MTFLHFHQKMGQTENFTFILSTQDGNMILQLRPSHSGCVTIKVMIVWIFVDNSFLIKTVQASRDMIFRHYKQRFAAGNFQRHCRDNGSLPAITVTEPSWISSSDGEQVVGEKERNNRSVKITSNIRVHLKDHCGVIVQFYSARLITAHGKKTKTKQCNILRTTVKCAAIV